MSAERRYQEFKAMGLELDMTRGKPSSEQLDLAAGLLTNLDRSDYTAADGTELLRRLAADGWVQVRQTGSHRQFHHPTKAGRSRWPARRAWTSHRAR
jgi:predicted RNA binding protein YcfA (HicA-like mRNA interferase family)